jgi:hypothetical protein
MTWHVRACALALLCISAESTSPGGLPLSAASPEAPASCPVTMADPTFVPPAPYPAQAPYGQIWIGTSSLWVAASADGIWRGIRRDTANGPAVANKQFWWRPGYEGSTEPVPQLVVTGLRLDAAAPPITVGPATNAHHRDFGGWTMLVAPEIPAGCWELTGQYARDRVSFVVWVPE